MTAIRHHYPQRFEPGPESAKPVFRFADGSVLSRDTIAYWLEAGADAENVSPERMGSHSLRIGGAVALHLQLKDLELVRRFGSYRLSLFGGGINVPALVVSLLVFVEQGYELYSAVALRTHYTIDVIMAVVVTFLFFTSGPVCIAAKAWAVMGRFPGFTTNLL